MEMLLPFLQREKKRSWQSQQRDEATQLTIQRLWKEIEKVPDRKTQLDKLSKKMQQHYAMLERLAGHQYYERIPIEAAINAIYVIVVYLYAEMRPCQKTIYGNGLDFDDFFSPTDDNHVIH
ncbi:MAG: hypothetical protein AAGB12_07825 [Pseudomonadota bacterium]